MELRAEIKPRMDIAETRYQTIFDYIVGYENYVDENGDEENAEYIRIENEIHKITGKDMSRYNLWETWEAEGPEVLAFRISLPDPVKIDDLTKEEIQEIVTKIQTFDPSKVEEDSFEGQFSYYISDYYHAFLKLNCKKYNYSNFLKQKNGTILSIEEIVDKLS